MADKIFSKPIFMGVGRAAAGGGVPAEQRYTKFKQ